MIKRALAGIKFSPVANFPGDTGRCRSCDAPGVSAVNGETEGHRGIMELADFRAWHVSDYISGRGCPCITTNDIH